MSLIPEYYSWLLSCWGLYKGILRTCALIKNTKPRVSKTKPPCWYYLKRERKRERENAFQGPSGKHCVKHVPLFLWSTCLGEGRLRVVGVVLSTSNMLHPLEPPVFCHGSQATNVLWTPFDADAMHILNILCKIISWQLDSEYRKENTAEKEYVWWQPRRSRECKRGRERHECWNGISDETRPSVPSNALLKHYCTVSVITC